VGTSNVAKPSQELVRALFNYDPRTGHLLWKKPLKNGCRVGDRAGRVSGRRYRHVGFYRGDYIEHRIIWLHVYGEWPSEHIDHINGDRQDNRIANLRLASATQNQINRKSYNSNSGFRNVWRLKSGRYRAVVTLGTYDTAEEAAQVAYKIAKLIHGEFVSAESYQQKDDSDERS
jgi:HNH endonuclease